MESEKLVGQKKFEDKCKDPEVLSKVNRTNMAVIVEAIKEYLRSYHSVKTAPLAYERNGSRWSQPSS